MRSWNGSSLQIRVSSSSSPAPQIGTRTMASVSGTPQSSSRIHSLALHSKFYSTNLIGVPKSCRLKSEHSSLRTPQPRWRFKMGFKSQGCVWGLQGNRGPEVPCTSDEVHTPVLVYSTCLYCQGQVKAYDMGPYFSRTISYSISHCCCA